MTELRTVEVLEGVVWKTRAFKDIKKGDFFRMFEPDGIQVFGEGLAYMWEATSEVYMGPSYVLEVKCILVDPIERDLKIIEITGKV